MTTTSTTPAPATPTALSNTTLVKDWHWLLSHLLAVTLAVALIGGGVCGLYYMTESAIQKHDQTTESKFSALLAAQAEQTKSLSQQFQASEAQHAQVEAELLAQNQQFAKEVAARNAQLAQQVKVDATLSAEQAAARIAEQIQVQPSEVVAQGDNVTLDLPAARDVTSDLDRLPVAVANLDVAQKQLANETQVATNAQADTAAAKAVIDSQTKQLADASKECDARVAVEKAKTKKAGIKGFFVGVGTVLTALAGHYI